MILGYPAPEDRREENSGVCVVDLETLECGPGACLDPGQAGRPDLARLRAGVRSYLHGVHPDRVVDATVVVTELVTNAVLHASSPVRLRLRLHNRGRRLRVEVTDASPDPPRVRTPDVTGGRGLRLVEGVSGEWGVVPTAGGKTVWAEVPLTAASPATSTTS